MNPDRKVTPNDEEWWASFESYLDKSFEGSSGCKRVHPHIERWVDKFFESPPEIPIDDTTLIAERFYEIRSHLPSSDNDKSRDIRERILLIEGRNIRGDTANDREEIKQAIACLSTEVQGSLLEDVSRDVPYEFIEPRITSLAARYCGEEHARFPIGVMLVGWAFQESLERGELDDI